MTITQEAPGLQKLVAELDVLIRSSFSVIAVETYEEPRFRRAVEALTTLSDYERTHVYYWSRPTGLRRRKASGLATEWEVIEGGQDPFGVLEQVAELTRANYVQPKRIAGEQVEGALFVLADYHHYLMPLGQEEPEVVRMLRELAWELESTLATVLFVSPAFPRVPSLEKELRVIQLALPEEHELGAMLDAELPKLASRVKVSVDDPTRERIISGGLGLTASEFRNNFYRSVVSRRSVGPETVEDLVAEKNALVRRLGFELSDPTPPDHMGGADGLLERMYAAADTYTEAAREYGVDPFKGWLFFGYPGTGKDLAMSIAAWIFNKPLLRIEMGTIVGAGGGVLGQGMERLKAALSIGEAVGAIIGLSEFEKGFGGLESSNQTDGGETARLIGYFLSYMAESRGTLFIGTANDISELKAEQLRAGRFDELVFMDLPRPEERAEIFAVHLRLRGRDPEKFDLEALSSGTEQFTGAEIRAAVNGGLLTGFRAGREVETGDILAAARNITPAARLGRAKMESMLEYAENELGLKIHRRAEKPTAMGGERAVRI